jgi:hypothetical protein
MNLLTAMGVDRADDIDPTRPIEISGFTLGPEAAEEVIRLVEAGAPATPVHFFQKPGVSEPFYWLLSRRGNAIGEAFGFPKDRAAGLPTALEIAIVRAIASAPEAELSKIIEGDYFISLGHLNEIDKVCSMLTAVRSPLNGHSILLNRYASIDLTESADEQLSPVVIKCLQGSFEPMPLKFRFLELYRAMEARFLREIKQNLLSIFDTQPKIALDRATKSLGSELAQMMALSDIKKPYFEMVWSAVDTVRTTNRLAIALFRKMSSHDELQNSQAKSGAALIYFLRCAIVHAGQKDMIYEAYPDGDDLLDLVMEHVEEASLALAGIHLT